MQEIIHVAPFMHPERSLLTGGTGRVPDSGGPQVFVLIDSAGNELIDGNAQCTCLLVKRTSDIVLCRFVLINPEEGRLYYHNDHTKIYKCKLMELNTPLKVFVMQWLYSISICSGFIVY